MWMLLLRWLCPLFHLLVVVMVERPVYRVVSATLAFAAANSSTFAVLAFAFTFAGLLLLADFLCSAAVLDGVVGLRRPVALADAVRALFLA
jgi:hypothetical protein